MPEKFVERGEPAGAVSYLIEGEIWNAPLTAVVLAIVVILFEYFLYEIL